MPSPSELLSCKGKAATADAKYRLKARKLKSFSEAFHNSHGIGYSQKISTILLGVLLDKHPSKEARKRLWCEEYAGMS